LLKHTETIADNKKPMPLTQSLETLKGSWQGEGSRHRVSKNSANFSPVFRNSRMNLDECLRSEYFKMFLSFFAVKEQMSF
jgi:hypothetical protein